MDITGPIFYIVSVQSCCCCWDGEGSYWDYTRGSSCALARARPLESGAGPAPLITNGTNINLVTIHLPGQPESGPFTEAKKCSYTGHRSQLRPPGAGRLCHKMSTFSTSLVRRGYTQTRKIKHDWGFLLRKKQILNLKELLVLYFA